MTSQVSSHFWKQLAALPAEAQELARKQYAIWVRDHFHPSMYFKPVATNVWAVRIGIHYRALGRVSGDAITWFWIGHHSEYDRLIRGL